MHKSYEPPVIKMMLLAAVGTPRKSIPCQL